MTPTDLIASGLTGKEKYGRLTVVSVFNKINKNYGHKDKYARCICDCGKKRVVKLAFLKYGHTQSCGCQRTDKITKHGYYKHPLYRIWAGMISRCSCPTVPNYKYYGARGITVCDEWMDAKTFIDWGLANGYKKGLTIERRKFNGNYEPSNCTFLTRSQNAKNTRKCILTKINGKVYTQRDLAKKYNICRTALRNKLKLGVPLMKAIKQLQSI